MKKRKLLLDWPPVAARPEDARLAHQAFTQVDGLVHLLRRIEGGPQLSLVLAEFVTGRVIVVNGGMSLR
jgi:hypothetical protein